LGNRGAGSYECLNTCYCGIPPAQTGKSEAGSASDLKQPEVNAEQFSGRYYRDYLSFNDEQMENSEKLIRCSGQSEGYYGSIKYETETNASGNVGG